MTRNKRRKKIKWRPLDTWRYRKSIYGDAHIPSKGEKEIAEVLKSLKINFIDEVEFKRLQYHYFDFLVPSRRLVIEYDGYQHFTADNKWDKGDKKKFKERVDRDKIKDIFCKSTGLEILRIPFNTKKSIESLIIKALNKKGKAKKVVKRPPKDKRLLKEAKKEALKNQKKPTTIIDGKVYYRKLKKL